jgi:hypothetical protein
VSTVNDEPDIDPHVRAMANDDPEALKVFVAACRAMGGDNLPYISDEDLYSEIAMTENDPEVNPADRFEMLAQDSPSREQLLRQSPRRG